MANPEHVKILKQGMDVWNNWREENPWIKPSLRGASLDGTDLRWANLRWANLRGVTLRGANLRGANLRQANLSGGANLRGAYLSGGANLKWADLSGAKLSGAKLSGANLRGANLRRADLRGADLSGADLVDADISKANFRNARLTGACLVGTNAEGAILTGCSVYGVSVWNLQGEPAEQTDLVITTKNEAVITVDNLEVAQFVYMMLQSEKLRKAIDTISRKVVLILGRFTPKRKAVLDAIREKLREYDYIPMLFDFSKGETKTFIETVSTLAHLARFVIADFTEPKIVLQELPQIIQNVFIPVKPLLLEGSGEEPVTLFDLRVDATRILDTFRYKDRDHLLEYLKSEIIDPVEKKATELDKQKRYPH